ncbi:MAG: hypothetical protein MEQ07_01500 [Aquimonas sp.]|nr:hypothetical protein [Aquimonas sp.]
MCFSVLALSLLLAGQASGHALFDAALPVQLGPRPFFLVDDMPAGALKEGLQACAAERGRYRSSRLSIGHRGAPLQFPEHSRESYVAAARMGAGIIECDVTFTRDLELVCRHGQGDLHTTTDILLGPLAERCTRPFAPAEFDADGRLLRAADAECRSSDLSLAEFRQLRARMDAHNPQARTVEEYLDATPRWRTDLYAGAGGQLMSHADSIALFQQLGVDMTPELKAAVVELPFQGMDRRALALKLLEDYRAVGVEPARVWPQSFHEEDVRLWLAEGGDYGRQAVMLDGATDRGQLMPLERLAELRELGLRYYAPPLFALLALDGEGRLTASAHAQAVRELGLQLIAWSLERSGPIGGSRPSWYYQDVEAALQREGQVLEVVDVLVREAGVVGIFTDWPATVSFYANCD